MIRNCHEKFSINSRESAGLLDLALAVVDARVAVARVDDLRAHLAVIPGGAHALKVPVGQRPTRGAILTRVRVAEVALAQDARVNIRGGALEQAGGAGQQKLVLHDGGSGALGDPRLDVVSLDPLGEPAHAAVAVEGLSLIHI